ncbi:cytochrome C assembly family protein [Gilvimarinus algae]|uniref:Cytochrome c biogenesis protein CcsA n=1 Tax=Gilvimarinus algae TaxID=3058037 RepID=A0ABT8TE39_9GAMM|nr:cytochrome c biogenesis protein CcsA [Gilvimarinus sp. SDUM040014]MDO3382308.1 cytochrome c biogenesis protein CcsA [Gilvimarinus sp. SDUM040014]
MSAHFANYAAIGLYVLAASYLIVSVARLRSPSRPALFALTATALLCHAVGCYRLIITPDGLALQLFAMLSLVFFTVNTIVLASAARKPVHNLFLLLFPMTVLAVSASLLFKGASTVYPLTLGLASHVLLSVIAYSVLTIATLQALFLAFANYRLKHKRTLTPLKLLPPLQTMESLLFEMLWAGQVLLSASIVSGIIFLEDIFAQHVVHKTVFTLLAWLIYSVLLWGRHSLGWRGYTAIRWTLVGFAMLMLAYFGSKLVLEFILNGG